MKAGVAEKQNTRLASGRTGRSVAAIAWVILAGISVLLLAGCKDDSPAEPPPLDRPCTSKTDCAFGMICLDGFCEDRGKENALNNDGREPLEEMLKRDEELRQQTENCRESAECQNRGRCQGTPGGTCIVAEQAHCENAEITCKQEGKCTYVPEEYGCCESKMGSVCERP